MVQKNKTDESGANCKCGKHDELLPASDSILARPCHTLSAGNLQVDPGPESKEKAHNLVTNISIPDDYRSPQYRRPAQEVVEKRLRYRQGSVSDKEIKIGELLWDLVSDSCCRDSPSHYWGNF